MERDDILLVFKNLKDYDYDISIESNQEDVIKWLDDRPNIAKYLALENPQEVLARSFLEDLRVKNRKFPPHYRGNKKELIAAHEHNKLYNDINEREDSRYESSKMGHVTLDNINVGKMYLHIDSFFSTNTSSEFSITLSTSEQYNFNIKSVPDYFKDIKSIKTSDIFIPTPLNTSINTDDLIKMDIKELSNLSMREFPKTNFMFLFRSEIFGNRFRLTPLNDTYQFTNYISNLHTLTFRFYYQNLKLTFPSSCIIGTIDFSSNPMRITSISHSLSSGDKISIYRFQGDPRNLDCDINSMHTVTVLTVDVFTIPIDPTNIVGLHGTSVSYYVLKNKIECELELTFL
jgi:hypothetical protein